ncbi:MAG: helix-hairpin-helix domain-containing protein [Parabacteroides sp.]|nr:helix-hairpin-helix domain-containing protein [Parabacteroides sp.]
MKKWFINMLVCLLISCYYANSQTIQSVDKWMEYVEEMASEVEDEAYIESLYADLSYLVEHPFEINSVTEEQLKRLPFLSDLQIHNLLEYRKKYGKLVTLYELKHVEAFDMKTISLLLPFVYVGELVVDKHPITVKNLLKYGSNTLQIRYDQCFQQKKGYSSYPDSILELYPNRSYLGEPFYHAIRYTYEYDDRIYGSLVAEKDAGEPFWNKHHKGYDYYAVNIFLKEMNKWLKSLTVGDYKVSFGQGLVISHDFSSGRTALITQVEKRNNGFRRHFSTNEQDYMRGAATTIRWKVIDLSLFYSYRKLDAHVDSNFIRSFKTDGLHRLVRDREKLRTVSMQTYGGNIRYASPNLCLGVTALSYSFGNHFVKPDEQPYNTHYFQGHQNWNIGMDYLLKNRWIKFYGETAISKNKAISTLNALQLTPVSYFSLLLLHRYYDKKYHAFFGNAFSQNSTLQNEQGLYMALQWTPFAHWKCAAYVDFFRFPWLKYQVNAPSVGKEYMVQLDYTPNQFFSTYIRYKYRQKEKNHFEDEDTDVRIIPYTNQQVRLQAVYALSPSVSFRTSADVVFYKEESKQSKGWMVAQSMGWKPIHLPIRMDLYVAGFHTNDYKTRLYSYEKNLLYAFNMPSFYGKGIRSALTFQWNILKQLTFSVKLGYTRYFDRDIIGTDLEEIEGSVKTDLYSSLRWKF